MIDTGMNTWLPLSICLLSAMATLTQRKFLDVNRHSENYVMRSIVKRVVTVPTCRTRDFDETSPPRYWD